MATSRWIRLDVSWDESDWLFDLSGAAAGCWPRLLCMIKRDGVRGQCKAPSLRVLASKWRVAVTEVEELIDAAVDDGALEVTEDDEWIVTGWEEHQGDPAGKDRTRRHREKKAEQETVEAVEDGLSKDDTE